MSGWLNQKEAKKKRKTAKRKRTALTSQLTIHLKNKSAVLISQNITQFFFTLSPGTALRKFRWGDKQEAAALWTQRLAPR